MSEPKIGEFLESFDVQVSAGSLSNILTQTAFDFEQEYSDVLGAGLGSTRYQQTDDASAESMANSGIRTFLANRSIRCTRLSLIKIHSKLEAPCLRAQHLVVLRFLPIRPIFSFFAM